VLISGLYSYWDLPKSHATKSC